MKTAGCVPAIAIALVCAACALGAGLPVSTPGLSTLTAILWLLGAGGAICLLLRRAIDADDRARDLATRLVREQDARRASDAILGDTQTVLSKLVRQQDSARDGERGRIAREIDGQLGQTLLTLRVELCLLQAASHGVQPSVHTRTGAMIGTLDLALHSLRAVVDGLRPLALSEGLRAALERQLEEFTRLNGIAHQLEIAPATFTEPECAAFDGDALLYRVLQEALAELADQASATEVRVRLQRGDAGLTLRIDDNGDGSRPVGGRCNPRCASGLAGMRVQVEASGGALRIAPVPGGGTVLALTLPWVRGLALN
jgi:signal transduction histidine kinase